MRKLVSVTVAVMFLFLASPFVSVMAYSSPSDGGGSHNTGSVLQLAVGTPTSPGVITYAGNQMWMQSGGQLVEMLVGGAPAAQGGDLSYNLVAKVTGLRASGTFSMKLSDSQDGVSMKALGRVVGYIPSVCFPNYDTPNALGQCASSDSSGIPAFFEAYLVGSLNMGGQTTQLNGVFLVESGILNPFGGPIVISAADNSIVIVATYSRSTVDWKGVQLAGVVSGTFNNAPVSGSFMQTVNAHEDLVTGMERELGTVSFVGMSISSLNAQGRFSGLSTTPTTGTMDCSSMMGLPPGTCTATALNSTGTFMMQAQDGTRMTGTYGIYWPAPSIVFGGQIYATVYQPDNHS